MRVSPGTWIAVFSVALSPVAAWEFTAYADSYSCFAKADTQYRIISGGSTTCYTFGRDMPDTSCQKFNNGGGSSGPCDSETFDVYSCLVQPDTACQVFTDENCQIGSRTIYPKKKQPTCGNAIGLSSQIKSFTCIPAQRLAGTIPDLDGIW